MCTTMLATWRAGDAIKGMAIRRGVGYIHRTLFRSHVRDWLPMGRVGTIHDMT